MVTAYGSVQVSTSRRTDPRVKVLYVLWIFVIVSFVADPRILSAVLLVTVGAVFVARLSLWELVKSARFGFFVAVASFLLWVVFLRGRGPALLHLGWFRVTAAGLANGWSVAARIAAILLSCLLLFRTSRTREVMTALYRLRVSVPFAMVVSIVLRLIPQLQAEHAVIVEAQRSRGVEFNTGGLLSRMRKHMAYLIPLVLRALKITSDLSLAMEARGFDPYAPRTFSQNLHFDSRDYFLMGLMGILLAVALAARIQGFGGMPTEWLPS
jgi:energy-coupling factor transport system permease protein